MLHCIAPYTLYSLGSIYALHAALYRSIYTVLTRSYLGKLHGFLGAFAKFRKVTLSFVNSACLSVCMEQLCVHWMDFREII